MVEARQSETEDNKGTQTEPVNPKGKRRLGWSRSENAEREQDKRAAKLETLKSRIEKTLESKPKREAQLELAHLSNLIPSLGENYSEERVQQLHCALKALETEPANLDFARITRQDLEYYRHRESRGMFRIVYRLAGATSLSAVLSGMVTSLLLIVIAVYPLIVLSFAGIRSPEVPEYVLVLTEDLFSLLPFAFAGSVLSILIRLEQFSKIEEHDPFLLFCTGFFKPYIGVVFGLIVYAILSSKIIIVSGLTENLRNVYLLWTIGFLSGFSERFAHDFIGRAENRFTASKGSNGKR